jgi:uncharacterized protein (TIGR03000 family)
MTRNLNPARFRFGWVCLLLAATPLCAQESGQRAILTVRLPADARLLVDGQETKQTGPMRRFTSPPLTPGKSYSYTFQWTFRKDSKTFKGEKKVRVRAGEDKEVDLTKENVEETSAAKGSERPKSTKDETGDKKEKTKEPDLDVPFVPTPQDVVDTMLKVAAITDKDVVYDLGCGDGRIVATAAKEYGCKAVGFDLDPKKVKEARETVKAKGVEKLVTIEEKDLFKVDLKPATVVTLYLLPDVNVKLLPQLEQLKPGARIVSHDFTIEGVKPAQKLSKTSKEDGKKHTIYVWIAPIKKKEK